MKKTIKIILLTVFILMGLSMVSNVKAATARIKASKSSATVGDKVTITVTINAAAWNLKVSGNGVSNASYVDNTDDANNATTTKTLNLDTASAGSKTIVLSGDVSDGDTGATTKVNETVSVVVNEKTSTPNTNKNDNNSSSNNNKNNNGDSGSNSKTQTTAKSSDTKLKSITVGGNSYSIGKSVTVSADTTSINIKATANSSKAKVTGTGTKELVTGTNNFDIKVTAENGNTKTYRVTVIREEFVNDTPNIEDPNQAVNVQELRLTSLNIQGVELIPQFSSEVFEYNVYIINENELKIDAISNIEGTNIEITGNTNLVEGENIAIIKLTKDDKTTEYKVKINKTIVEDENKEDVKKVNFVGWISNWWNGPGSTILVFTVILILLGAATIFAVISYKYSKDAQENAKNYKNI